MSYPYEQIFAGDPSAPERVAVNGVVTIFEPGDATMTPLTITTLDGLPLANPMQVNESGFGPAFQHETLDQVAWAGGGFTGVLTSYKGMKEAAVGAQQGASAAAINAEQSRLAAEDAVRNAQAPSDEAVDAALVRADLPGVITQAVSGKLDKGDASNTFAVKPDNGGKPVGKGELAFNVRDYGAKGDGTADDTGAIQCAINASVGKTLVFPPGAYKITAPLNTAGSGHTFICTGATISAYWSGSDYSMLYNGRAGDIPTAYSGHGDLTIIGGIWDARGHANAISFSSTFSFAHADGITLNGVTMRNVRRGHAIDCTANRRVRILNCRFEGYTDTGSPRITEAVQIDLAVASGFPKFGAYDATPCTDVLVHGCTFAASADCGLWPRAVGSHTARTDRPHTNIRIVSNTIAATESAVRALNWNDATVFDNDVTGCCINIFAINAATPSEDTMNAAGTQTNASAPMSGISILDNRIAGSSSHAVYISGYPASGIISGAKVRGNTSKGQTAGSGIYLASTANSSVDDNTMIGSPIRGIFLSASTLARVTSNSVDMSGDHGIMVDGCAACTISTNTVTNAGQHGISLSSGGADNAVTGNAVIGASRATNLASKGIRLNSVANTKVTNNTVRVGANPNKPSHGFEVAGGASGTFYTGNDFRTSGVTAPILDGGTGSIITASAS